MPYAHDMEILTCTLIAYLLQLNMFKIGTITITTPLTTFTTIAKTTSIHPQMLLQLQLLQFVLLTQLI